MRGGTLKGAYFLRENLPADEAEMNQVLLSVIGSSHELQKSVWVAVEDKPVSCFSVFGVCFKYGSKIIINILLDKLYSLFSLGSAS